MVALLADIPRVTCPTELPVSSPALPVSSPAQLSANAPRVRCGPSPAVLRRRRIGAVALLLLLVLTAWFGLQAALGRIGGSPLAITGAPGGPQRAAGRIWIVRPGDTLWSIAEAVDRRGDVRPLVYRLAAEVRSTDLYPGEPVAIPAG